MRGKEGGKGEGGRKGDKRGGREDRREEGMKGREGWRKDKECETADILDGTQGRRA